MTSGRTLPSDAPPRRVTFVLPDFEAGGAQRVMLAIAAGLDRSRFVPSLLVLDDRGPWRSLVANDIAVVSLGQPRLRYALRLLPGALRESRPDVVVSTIGYLNFGVLVGRPPRAQVRVIVRESNSPRHAATHPLTRALQRFAYAVLYRRADAVVSPSRLIGDELVTDYHVPQRLIRIIRNPIDEAALRTNATPPSRRPGPGARYVAVGRLSPQKGYERLLKALAPLAGDAHISVFGEGEQRAMLEAQCQALGLANRVSFAGFNPNPAPWIAGADALLLGSYWEGLPNVALEALACGTPVVATPEAGGIGEIAQLASPGSVRIAPMGPDFLAAMADTPRNTSAQLRPSLLPAEFKLATVVSEYERAIWPVEAGGLP